MGLIYAISKQVKELMNMKQRRRKGQMTSRNLATCTAAL